MHQPQEILIENLINVAEELKFKRLDCRRISRKLAEYNISAGTVQKWINNSKEELPELDPRELCLFTEAVYEYTKDMYINPTHYYTEREIKEAKTTYRAQDEPKIELPLVFYDVTKVSDDDYITTITAKQIKALMDSKILQYNFETQREARYRFDKEKNDIVPEAKVNKNSVKEISELFEKNELISTLITFNARLGTSDEGEELIYDPKKRTLTITEGTLLDYLDGFHRGTGIAMALENNPNLDMTFKLNILNYDIPMAQKYFHQMNKVNPVSKNRLDELNNSNMATFVVKQLQTNSELQGKVFAGKHIHGKFLVTHSAMTNAINEAFNLKNKIEAIQCSKYLTEFFNTLCFAYPEAFITDTENIRKKSMINDYQMFYGYVFLAKRMMDENIPLNKLTSILNSINFDKDSPMWSDLYDSRGNLLPNRFKKIKELFLSINLKMVV